MELVLSILGAPEAEPVNTPSNSQADRDSQSRDGDDDGDSDAWKAKFAHPEPLLIPR